MVDFTPQERETIQSEKSVIGVMMMEPEQSDKAFELLNFDMFYSQELGNIFECCKELKEKGMRADPVTVIDKLGSDYQQLVLNCAETVPSISGFESYIQGVLESWRCRSIRSKLNELCENGMDADALTYEIQEIVQNQEKITSSVKNDSNKTFQECVQEYLAWQRKPNNSVKMGMSTLDKVTGGLQMGCITVISARPGCGKTTLALQMANNICNEYKVLYISLEMTSTQLIRNIISNEARVNSQDISEKTLTPQDQKEIAEAIELMYNKKKLIINDKAGQSIIDVEKSIKATNPKVVVIDHLRLLTPLVKRKSEAEETAEITHALKQMAKKYNINIIELAQAKRESEGRVPGMSDLYGGSAIEQDADMVIGLCPEAEYTLKDNCTTTVAVTKNRHGSSGSFEFGWEKPFNRMTIIDTRIEE